MNAPLSARKQRGLLAHVAVGVAATVAVSAGIAALGWMSPRTGDIDALPGVIVALVWAGLIGGLGAARWLAGRSGEAARSQRGAITALALACLLFPFYTAGLSNLAVGLAANVAIAIACARIADRLAISTKAAAVLVALPIPWLVLASTLIVREWILATS